MGDVARPHRTRPVEVLITEPLTTANRGEIARWLEDQGVQVGVPADIGDGVMLTVLMPVGPHEDHLRDVYRADRVVVAGREVDIADQAHYKLWYEPVPEPIERTEPS